MKIRPVGAEFHAGGRTDMTKLIVAFHNFANAPKNPLLFKCNLNYRISCYLMRQLRCASYSSTRFCQAIRFVTVDLHPPAPVAARSKEWVCALRASWVLRFRTMRGGGGHGCPLRVLFVVR